MKKQQNPPIDELNVFHPLVKVWLKSNGYAYKYEYKMPDYGRIDFLAKKGKSHFLIECKCDKSQIRKAIIQVAAYRLQMPECQAVIAIPTGWVSKKIRAMAARYEVWIIEIDIPEQVEIDELIQVGVNNPYEGLTWIREYNDTVAMKQDWLDILEYIGEYPDSNLSRRIIFSLNMLILRTINQAYNDEILSALSFLTDFPPSRKPRDE